jgi:hypothetical protein
MTYIVVIKDNDDEVAELLCTSYDEALQVRQSFINWKASLKITIVSKGD